MVAGVGEPMFFTGGEWRRPTGESSCDVVNPANGEVLATVRSCSDEDVELAVAAAGDALAKWAATPVAERVALLRRLRDAIAEDADRLALLITRQMGTPIGFSRAAQIGLPLRTFDVVLAEVDALEDERVGRSAIVRDPAGVVAAITPWNFPLHQIAAKIVPALAAGCTVVLKPSEVTPLDAIRLTELIEAVGFPDGVFNLVLGAADAGRALVSRRGVSMVSFTGSTAAGRAIAAVAGGDLKKLSLELGGKSANILLDDVAFAEVVPQAIGQCFVNAGQTCAALTRLIVPAQRLPEIEAIALAALAEWRPGDPEQADTRMGPLSSARQRDRVAELVSRALDGGARVVGPAPGLAPRKVGDAFFPPIVLSDVDNGMEIAREEVFGPVLVLMPYADEDEAVRIANDSAYGLSGGVWSADLDRAEAVGRRLRTGQVILNGAMLDMEAPFGGVGQSGLGRENGRYGLDEFFSLKAITRPAAK
ncbi:MAG: aldehyde dehydrogenase family protein [Sphingomonas sp.]